MKKWILRASILALAATACKKNGPESSLPPATQDGRNTAGWLADGVAHVASNYDGDIAYSSPSPAMSGGFGADSVFGISIRGYKDPLRPEVGLFFKAGKPGTYYIDGRTMTRPLTPACATYEHVASPTTRDYVTTTRYTGRVVLTRVDLRSGAAAGTFEFRAVNPHDSTQTITITNGRFDYAGR